MMILSRRIRSGAGLAVFAIAISVSAGCLQPDFDIERIKEMMPARPAQLDRLDMLVGQWQTEGEVNMFGLDEPFAVHGTSEATWEHDRWFLVDRAEFDMGPLGPMSGTSVWTWDPKARKYRMWWFDSFGETATGTAVYKEATKSWRIHTRGRNAWCNIVNRGTITLDNDGSLHWTWTQWDAWHIWKISRMSGTSRRK